MLSLHLVLFSLVLSVPVWSIGCEGEKQYSKWSAWYTPIPRRRYCAWFGIVSTLEAVEKYMLKRYLRV